MVTRVALDAVTVSVEDAPELMEVGLAVTETLGVAMPLPVKPPQPAKTRENASPERSATEEWRRDRNRGKMLFDT
jgi:hypothetical protein